GVEHLAHRTYPGESRAVKRRAAGRALRVRISAGIEEHPHDLFHRGSCVVGHGRMQRGEAAVARGGPHVGTEIEQRAYRLRTLEERGEPERMEAVLRHAIDDRGVSRGEL